MNPARCASTYIGTATLLLEIGTLRLLTDPALDPAGNDYSLEPAPGIVIGSRKLVDPALSREGLGSIDAVLLSHDEHFDNLDGAGRELLSEVGVVLTTPPGAQRLGGQAVGLGPWTSLDLDGHPNVRVTAVPARHGPEGTEGLIGDVTGFVLEWEGQGEGVLYISGDTVWFDEPSEIGERFDVDTGVATEL